MPSPTPYAPCPGCQTLVLTGQTRDGTAVCLDVSQRTYVALWEPEPKTKGVLPHYVMVQSAGYPEHQCEHQQPGKE